LNLDSKKDFDIVTYKNKSYSTSDIRSRINDIPQYHFEKIESIDRLKIVIKGLILQEHLLILAKEKGYDKSEYVVEKLKGMKTNLLMRYKISEIIENANIEDSTVYSFYKKNQDFFSTHNQINVQEIIVEDLELARELVRKINSGIDFGELSKKYSIRKFSAKNNGILGLLPVSKFGKMQNVFSSSPIGKVIGPIEINDLYGIFKILERTESEIIEFEKARDIATLAVKYKIKNNILRDYVENLKSKNEVNIDLEKLGSTKIFQYN
jgi:parvulin-like peptidyl-prolyl isomerase